MATFKNAFLKALLLLWVCLAATTLVAADDEASPPPKEDDTKKDTTTTSSSTDNNNSNVNNRQARPLAKEVPQDTFDVKSHFEWGTYYDPKSVFCGKYDCYGILGFDYESFASEKPTHKMITKRYRALSRHWHPDKSKHPDAKERFQVRYVTTLLCYYYYCYYYCYYYMLYVTLRYVTLCYI